MSCEKQP